MKANELIIGQKYIWRRNSEVSHEVIYLGTYGMSSCTVYDFEYIVDGEIKVTGLCELHIERDIKEIYNIGEVIQFYRCCNADRELYEGVISMHEGLGLIVSLDGEIHELKKMIDIKKLVEIF